MVFCGKAICFYRHQSNSYCAALERIAPQINFRLATTRILSFTARPKPEICEGGDRIGTVYTHLPAVLGRRFLVQMMNAIAQEAIMTDPNLPSPKITYPEWQHELQAALMEHDREKLLEQVTAAEAAIFNRLQAISQSQDHEAERHAIQDALARLRILKRDSLGFPDWKKS